MQVASFQKLILVHVALAIIFTLADESIFTSAYYDLSADFFSNSVADKIISGALGDGPAWLFITISIATFISYLLGIVQCYRLKNSGRYLLTIAFVALLLFSTLSGDTISAAFLVPIEFMSDGTLAILFYVMFFSDLKDSFE